MCAVRLSIRRNRRGRSLPAWLLLPALPLLLGSVCAAASPTDEINVQATAQDAAVEITTRAVVHAPAELIWQTLTDYDHLANFVPGIDSSRVVSRQGDRLVVEQRGVARWWFFSYPIHVEIAATERPYRSIDVRLLQGNLRRLEGEYRIEPQPDGSTELTWHGVIEPDTPLPGFVRTALLRRSISEQFAGMVREIERRADRASSASSASS